MITTKQVIAKLYIEGKQGYRFLYPDLGLPCEKTIQREYALLKGNLINTPLTIDKDPSEIVPNLAVWK